MGGTPLSLQLFEFAVIAYTLSIPLFVLHLVFRKNGIANAAVGFVLLGWPLHLSSVIARGLEGGHWPLGDMYEYSTGISLIVSTTALALMLRGKMRLIGLPSMVVVVALLGVGYMTYVPPGQLVPALHSYWLTIHVTSMATSSALFSFSFIFAMGYLARRWADQTTGMGPGAATAGEAGFGWASVRLRIAAAFRGLPSARFLDSWSYRFVALGFPIWTFGVICGAVWGEHAWGRYWGWDPKETFAFITWVIFAIYMHARVTMGWKEKRAAAITVLGFISVLFTLYAVNLWIAGLHSYARA